MTSVKVNNITVEYEDTGSGEPLLLVHGLSGQLTDWPPRFIDVLADRGFRVIRADNRDAGLSSEMTGTPPTVSDIVKTTMLRRPIRSEYLLSDFAADEVALLDHLGIERVHVVGASMGGMIAQTIAIEHPSRVLSLTSIMSTTGNRKVGRPKPSLLRKFARREVPTRETAVDRAVVLFRELSGPAFDEAEFRVIAEASVARSFRPEGTARQLAAILASGDRTRALGKLDVPTLVIHGMLDPLVRPSGGIATAKAVPGARLLMFPDMGHDLPRARWGEIADAIAVNAARGAAVPVAAG